jgi:Mn-dependent DtxR family transcriptional regulator
MPIYFSKDSKINLTADDSNFISTLKYTGQGSIENQYIAKKINITSQSSYENLYKLDEIDFLNKVNEIKVSVTALYKRLNFRILFFTKRL